MESQPTQAVSYIEWLRQSKGQPTFRSMLEADLHSAIEDANDLGHFFMLMEHSGYEIHHGNRLGFRLRGQERFMYPGRKNRLFTEDGICAAIQGNLEEIEAGRRPAIIHRPRYQPYKKHPKYTGIMALYVHYLYVLGKIEQRQYSPRMTPQMKAEVMKFERCREQFAFLRKNGISTQEDIMVFQAHAKETPASLTKQRTILNVRKKKRHPMYMALADVNALVQAKALYEEGLSGMEAEFAQYMDAVSILKQCNIPCERLKDEKAELYEQLAQVNSEIRAAQWELAMCQQIQNEISHMARDIHDIKDERDVHHRQRVQ